MSQIPVQVFARAPVPGEVKTRLIPAIGAKRAASLYAHLLKHTTAVAAGAGVGPVSLWCTPSCRHPMFDELRQRYGVRLRLQEGAHLGERMLQALEDAVDGWGGAMIVGSDCPFLEEGDLLQAAQYLHEDLDAVIGPATDGGYFLFAARRTTASVFESIEWGSEGVLVATRARLAGLGWKWRELAPRHDIDRPEDLELLGPEWRS